MEFCLITGYQIYLEEPPVSCSILAARNTGELDEGTFSELEFGKIENGVFYHCNRVDAEWMISVIPDYFQCIRDPKENEIIHRLKAHSRNIPEELIKFKDCLGNLVFETDGYSVYVLGEKDKKKIGTVS